MADSFYSSQILPGLPAPSHKQHRLAVIFIIIAILIILVVVFWWNMSPSQAPAPARVLSQQEQISAQLDSTVPPSPETAAAIEQQLKSQKTTVTPEQQAQIMQQLQASQ